MGYDVTPSNEVYTVNNESQHLLVCGVPALGLQDDLRKLCSRFGDVKSLVYIPKYSQEEFTDAYHVQYTRIQSARFGKRHMDGKSFFGGTLHVCYAPEMESVEETRAKLIQRRKDVAKRIRGQNTEEPKTSVASKQYHRQKKHPALPITAERLAVESANAECIWKGIPREIDPRVISPAAEMLQQRKIYGPQKPDEKWLQAGVKERKIIPSCSSVPSVKAAANSSYGVGSANTSQALRFIPRQVNLNKRIVFRNNRSVLPSAAEGKAEEKPGNKRNHEADNLSVEETILSVRNKIRAVSVPNVQIFLDRKQDV
ncbi:RNA-binding protein 48 isoform X2 [Anabrus simplex]|uniref:RNA-binding protein 48 isoform X2 n=1 Tax=Anabrus simplex TaxID=316456 RepID=UPI0035A2F61C